MKLQSILHTNSPDFDLISFLLKRISKNALHEISMLSALRLIEWIPLCLLHCLCRKFHALIGMHSADASNAPNAFGYPLCHKFSLRWLLVRCPWSSEKCMTMPNLPACFLHHIGTWITAHLAKCLIAIDYWVLNDLSICQHKRTIRCKKIQKKITLNKNIFALKWIGKSFTGKKFFLKWMRCLIFQNRFNIVMNCKSEKKIYF